MLGAKGEQVGIIIAAPNQGMVLCQRKLALNRRIDGGKGFFEQALGQGLNLFVAAYASVQGHCAGLVDQPAGIAPGKPDDAPQAALADTPLTVEQALAQLLGRRADGLGLGQNAVGFTRGSKYPPALPEDIYYVKKPATCRVPASLAECDPCRVQALQAASLRGATMPSMELESLRHHRDETFHVRGRNG